MRIRRDRPTLLLVVHFWGGGVIHYARLLRERVASRVNVVFTWGVDDKTLHLSTRDPEISEQSFDLARGLDAPVAALRALNVGRVDLLCTYGLQAHVEPLLRGLGVPFDVTLQGYELLANNNTHLIDGDTRFIGEEAVTALAAAIKRPPAIDRILHAAERRIACSRDLAWRTGRFLPDVAILPVRPPERDKAYKPPVVPHMQAGEPLRVLVLGRVAPHKGLATIREVARLADARNIPLEILCLGEPQVPRADWPASPRVKIVGRYDVDTLRRIVPTLRPHLAWFPFVWPETHSFVLSEVMALRLPLLAPGIGAVPERVAGRPATWLVPWDEATPEAFLGWLERLARDRLATTPAWMPTDHLPPLVPDFYDREYLTPLCGPTPVRSEPLQTLRRLYGRLTARGAEPAAPPPLPRPQAPPASAWDALARRQTAAPAVDVIVPVYRGYDDTLACLHSVLTSRNSAPFELIAIDDGSPEPALTAVLDDLAARGLIRLVRNSENRGFVRSTITGMALNPERDVILLNSDTIVTGDWIDRLRAHRLKDAKVGTLTPWSNNATLMSYPETFADNGQALELSFDALDRMAARELAGVAHDIPTGVGFCFYIARDCLNEVGTFNAEAFGRGYGEENDFCRRAAARGWRNLAACDVFVRHSGETSFQADASEARRLSTAALSKLHPTYMDLIGAFMRADPLRPARQKLDLARLRRWGRGQLRLIFGEAGETSPADGALYATPAADHPHTFRIDAPRGLIFPNLPALAIGEIAAARRLLDDMGVAVARIDSLAGCTAEQARFARELSETSRK